MHFEDYNLKFQESLSINFNIFEIEFVFWPLDSLTNDMEGMQA